MNNYIDCPRCGIEQRAEQTYCNKCGINMQKFFWEDNFKEKDEKFEKPKKGSFEKKFFRGKIK